MILNVLGFIRSIKGHKNAKKKNGRKCSRPQHVQVLLLISLSYNYKCNSYHLLQYINERPKMISFIHHF